MMLNPSLANENARALPIPQHYKCFTFRRTSNEGPRSPSISLLQVLSPPQEQYMEFFDQCDDLPQDQEQPNQKKDFAGFGALTLQGFK